MNIQAMMKQAQKLQQDMMKTKSEIDNKVFEGTSSVVKVEVLGNKTIKSVKIDMDECSKEDIEMLEDMLLVALNDAFAKVDRETEEKMGKYTNGMSGLF